MTEAQMESVTRRAVAPIAELILDCFRPDTFQALIGLAGLNRPSPDPNPDQLLPYPPLERGQKGFGRYRVTPMRSEDEVRTALLKMGDPYFAQTPYFCVRSILSCRSVIYGYDGQAYLCLRTEDEAPMTPDPGLIVVRDASAYLTETDYLDGVEAVEDW
jgi:hypothetical protein